MFLAVWVVALLSSVVSWTARGVGDWVGVAGASWQPPVDQVVLVFDPPGSKHAQDVAADLKTYSAAGPTAACRLRRVSIEGRLLRRPGVRERARGVTVDPR